MNKLKRGFTLIELLIVITILGVLAIVVLVALNPLEQLAKTRDAGRISTIAQIGHALTAYAVNNSGNFVPENATWMTSIVTAGEISTVPSAITYGTGGANCAVNAQNGFCYDATAAVGTAPMIVFARLEALANTSRCTATFAGTNRAYAIYSSSLGKGGVVCTTNADPTVGANAGGANWLP